MLDIGARLVRHTKPSWSIKFPGPATDPCMLIEIIFQLRHLCWFHNPHVDLTARHDEVSACVNVLLSQKVGGLLDLVVAL
jgi:hypothetical protein